MPLGVLLAPWTVMALEPAQHKGVTLGAVPKWWVQQPGWGSIALLRGLVTQPDGAGGREVP